MEVNMSTSLDIWKLLAGLGIFLFGMLLIEESVKALFGRAFRRIIRTYTNGRLRAIGSGAMGLILFRPATKPALATRLSIGFGFLFLGLDFMKVSVETFAQTSSLAGFAHYGLWVYLVVGTLFTALM
jgi:Na+/phosphate symporter